MTRFFIAILIVFFLMIQFDIWIKDDGLYRLRELEQMIESQNDENQRLKLKNQQLEQEIEELKSGTESIEEKARTDLGMIKEGEEFYLIVE
ncbi:MAG: septum formation initiator family protein [Gammaproteobacteria bacterium]|jgi:cell division protein FtsB|nr:cell division protein FtsB [Gammaproteobacteria bacterium]MBQ08451.1 cell division protein FtsB [Gammaproteobacteria bacterium]MDP6146798.1 septum formation initiator family protein [Gammaproteobacteria bacterium]HJN01337.1 septum formation initiator family protein [Gammaproteobacteria bacterium]|tara:strand:- start:24366 stop:24638 length:273 start_codon:yes stop_codon:yes gene_type:complete